jgi:hypothetical protein
MARDAIPRPQQDEEGEYGDGKKNLHGNATEVPDQDTKSGGVCLADVQLDSGLMCA